MIQELLKPGAEIVYMLSPGSGLRPGSSRIRSWLTNQLMASVWATVPRRVMLPWQAMPARRPAVLWLAPCSHRRLKCSVFSRKLEPLKPVLNGSADTCQQA
ncbi:hypothetical protein [Pseudoglutamicibacter albus]|uniref:hypothetical protein n=1 Tax=Pseudoglutamicibacter albus TaxID=98671 RepID=UPI00361B356A